ncbi:MAG TPA: HAD hydrolase-like protein [Microbacteriaceae bacterium]|mgnify:FL=1|jgi:phosphoglycolate phosphatase|nr:HAD hydrolase-like protein [Microbacteriaceae bacterium]HQX36154.1 HAD hydrolase-like protein [Microbacteriaceae bacterium]HQZ47129.1 HAD hydrolase-like protein [Microbacteriaceae bacterium]HRA08028.1 HAD hydrolase-like protein [Microbacteriaceae bacterium]
MSSNAPWTAVLWDMDGTIVDASVGILRRLETTLAHFDLPAPQPDELSHWIGPPLPESFREHAGMTPSQAAEAVKFYRRLVRREPESGDARVYPGIAELIREVHAAGIPQAIASSKPETQVVELLESFGLTPFFSVATGATADEVTRTAKVDIVIEARRRLRDRGVETSRVVLIGDRHHDVEGGVAAGVPVIFVRWGFSRPGEEDGAIATVDDVEQLRALLLPPRDAPPAASADELATEADRANG